MNAYREDIARWRDFAYKQEAKFLQRITELEQQLAKAEEALRFYAERDHYAIPPYSISGALLKDTEIEDDKGAKARAYFAAKDSHA